MKINRRSLRSEVHDIIVELISSGKLAPGQRIKEADLSSRLGISRTPLREALFALEAEGYVVADHAKGFSVVGMSLQEVVETYPILWTFENLALDQIADINQVDTEALRRINLDIRSAKRPERRKDLDTSWHTGLLAHCENTRLLDLIAFLKGSMRRYEIAYMRHVGLVEISVEQHERILQALDERNLASAKRLLQEHWRFGMDSLTDWLQREQTASQGNRVSLPR